jgi:predicted DNA-binding transcriptional regulator YafY
MIPTSDSITDAKPMARNEQLIRQHKLLQLLEVSRYGRTLEELRGDLVLDLGLTKLHERTVRRDIEALQAAGFDIQNNQLDRGKVFKLGGTKAAVHEVGISSSEMIALAIGRDLLFPLAGTQYWKGIETFWNKVQEVVPDGVFEHYSKHRETLHVFGSPHKSYERHEGMLKTINRAILEHRIVEMQYQPIGRDASLRRIEPYGLAVYQGSIYVVAAACDADEPGDRMRNFKLDRFRKVTALDEYFKPDETIRLSEHLGRGIGIFSSDSATLVRIRLSAQAAGWVGEDPWHVAQTLEPCHADEAGGGMVAGAILTVPASHPRELLPKVLSLGADAEVLSPPEFREAVASAVSKMANSYGALHS